MKNTFILSTMWIFLFVISLQAYSILDSKTEVSPGCDRGVLSHKYTSFISNVNKLNELNSNEPDSDELRSFDENLDTSDE